MVCLHGFTDTWRTWELVLPSLERRHDVLAPTLVGHAGGPPLTGAITGKTFADEIERAMDRAGFATAHFVGNSLGGFVALQLAARGRARSVVAFAPAGGMDVADPHFVEMVGSFAPRQERLRLAAPSAPALASTPEGRRAVTESIVESGDRVPAPLVAHMIAGVAACVDVGPLVTYVLEHGYELDAAQITCPVRFVWGTADRLLPWPDAASGFRTGAFAFADWIELAGVGHCPQLEVPTEAAALILDFAAD